MRSKTAQSLGDIGDASSPQQANHGIAQGRHHVEQVTLAHLGAIFIKGNIPHPMGLVLNVPGFAGEAQEERRWRAPKRQTGDAVDGFRGCLSVAGDLPLQTEDLLRSGPRQVVIERGSRLQAARLDASVPIGTGFSLWPLLSAKAGGGVANSNWMSAYSAGWFCLTMKT